MRGVIVTPAVHEIVDAQTRRTVGATACPCRLDRHGSSPTARRCAHPASRIASTACTEPPGGTETTAQPATAAVSPDRSQRPRTRQGHRRRTHSVPVVPAPVVKAAMIPVVVVHVPVRLHHVVWRCDVLARCTGHRRGRGTGCGERDKAADGGGGKQNSAHGRSPLRDAPSIPGVDSATIASGSWLDREYRRPSAAPHHPIVFTSSLRLIRYRSKSCRSSGLLVANSRTPKLLRFRSSSGSKAWRTNMSHRDW